MESLDVGEMAARHQLPFIAVRVIVDSAGDALPSAVVAAADEEGPLPIYGKLGRWRNGCPSSIAVHCRPGDRGQRRRCPPERRRSRGGRGGPSSDLWKAWTLAKWLPVINCRSLPSG